MKTSPADSWFEEDTVADSLDASISEKVRQHHDGCLPVF